MIMNMVQMIQLVVSVVTLLYQYLIIEYLAF